MNKEYRVVATDVRGLFKVFETDRKAAIHFVSNGHLVGPANCGHVPGNHKLQSRKAGITGNDSTWTDEQVDAEAESVKLFGHIRSCVEGAQQ